MWIWPAVARERGVVLEVRPAAFDEGEGLGGRIQGDQRLGHRGDVLSVVRVVIGRFTIGGQSILKLAVALGDHAGQVVGLGAVGAVAHGGRERLAGGGRFTALEQNASVQDVSVGHGGVQGHGFVELLLSIVNLAVREALGGDLELDLAADVVPAMLGLDLGGLLIGAQLRTGC